MRSSNAKFPLPSDSKIPAEVVKALDLLVQCGTLCATKDMKIKVQKRVTKDGSRPMYVIY